MYTWTAETELVERAQSGDEHAFAALVVEHRARLWSICLRMTGNPYDAEDALQDALTAAWVHMDSFRGDSRFGTWAYRVAANAALALLRHRRDTPVDGTEYFDVIAEPDIAEEFEDRSDQVASRVRIEAALARIPDQFREALVLREFGELSYLEIAAHQGVSIQTVKSRLNRARSALASALGNRRAAG